jgi:hypothetical protein
MPSTYSNLKIQLMATGENNTTWGNVTNVNLGTALEEAIVGSADVAFSSADVTLTLTDTNSTQSARNMRLNLTGTATAGYNLVVPAIEKPYIVNNGTDGTITVKNTTGTGIAVPAGKTMWVYNNGTNVVGVVTHLSSVTLGSALPVASGGTGVTTSTGTGSVVLSASPSFTGTVNFGPAIITGSGVSTGDAQFELGGNRSGDGPAYMDFHAVAGGDFNARVFRGSGANGNMEIVNAGTGVLSIATNAAEKMRITDAGNVGIGTTAPAAKLDVIGTIYSRPGGAAGAVAELTADASSGANGISLIAGFTSGGYGPIKLLTSATERMRIDSSGNVGIGTVSPGARLDVSGNARVTNNSSMQFRDFAGTGTANFTLQSDDNFVVTNAAGTPIQSFTQAANAFAVYGGNANNRMIVDSGSNIVYWNVNGSERMRIDASGNVMVGTVSATGLFSVAGLSYGQMIATNRFGVLGNNLYYGTGNFRYIGDGHAYGWTQGNTDGADLRLLYAGNNTSGAGAVATTSERIYITSSGFVGVGTSTDNGVDKLTVAGIVGSYISGRAGFHLYNGGATAEWFIGQPSASSHNLTFSKLVSGTYTDYVAIDSTGNVGIGNTSPTVTLDVTGGIKTSRTAVTSPATSDGNIFSGTYTPTLTNSTNVDISNSTAYTCQYMRVGDVVTVSGKVSIAVIGSGITRLNMTLPVSSNFSAEENCAGTAQVSYNGVSTNLAAQIKADTTNDRAQILYFGNVTGAAQDFFFTFTYRII